jgi:hypothetical protein
LSEWNAASEKFRIHTLFEQNAFNLVARRRTNVTALSMLKWNLHGEKLRDCHSKVDARGRVTLSMHADAPLLVHATSKSQDDVNVVNAVAGTKSGGISCVLKVFRNPDLLQLQQMWLTRFLTEAELDLRASGVITD